MEDMHYGLNSQDNCVIFAVDPSTPISFDILENLNQNEIALQQENDYCNMCVLFKEANFLKDSLQVNDILYISNCFMF